ncbi:MAG: lytic transglycosylase domain-containing protein, partial [Alphaproteobacteria bacterium]
MARIARKRLSLSGLVAFLAISVLAAAQPAAAESALPPQIAAAQPGVLDAKALPTVLSASDARLYRDIFALQEQGKWKTADKRIAALSDRRLLGHVLGQRYLHPTAYRSKYKELRDWLASYADHPDARRIYKLALKRRPKNYKMPKRPVAPRFTAPPASASREAPYRSTKRLNRSDRRKARQIKKKVRRNVLRTRLTTSEKLLASRETRRLLDQVEIDESYSAIAAAWFYYGKDQHAYDLADAAARRSGVLAPMTHWTAGLAAWRLERIEESAWHFSRLALSDKVSQWNAAAGAYWAARASLRLRNPAGMSEWLTRAARYPRTFYGLMAQRALGLQPRFDFHVNALDRAALTRLESAPDAARAIALLQVGQRHRAVLELRRLNTWADTEFTHALLALAERAGMPQLAFRISRRLANADHPDVENGALDGALYPIPPWQPRSGFTVDRALVYALVRQESGFNPKAKSPDGARGLMQLLPSTASFIARDRGYRNRKRKQLYDPATNLDLGQRYITHLLSNPVVKGDLFRLTTAYNGGPGNLNKWQRRMNFQDDPLLFIESLPSRETRLFIERVLTNFWIYRMRLGQRVPSLDDIAAGDWPRYTALDN